MWEVSDGEASGHRVYLNGYVPKLQAPGHIVGFLTRHLGKPVSATTLPAARTSLVVEVHEAAVAVPPRPLGPGHRTTIAARWRPSGWSSTVWAAPGGARHGDKFSGPIPQRHR